MNMSNRKKGNSSFWLSIIIAFLLSIFLTMASYLGGIYFGLFNKTLILDSLNKTSYYGAIVDYTVDKAEALAIPMGLKPEVFKDVFTLDETYAEGKTLIEANLNGREYTPNTSKMKERLISNINLYLKQQNLTTTTEQQANINTFANTVADEYSKNLTIPYIKYFTNLRNIFSKLVIVGIPVLLALSAFAVFLLIRLHSWLHRALRYIAYSTLATSLMTAIFPIFLLINGSYKRINITPEYFYNFIMNYITESILTFIYISLLLLAISIFLIAAIFFKRRELTKKKASTHHARSAEF